MQELHSILDRLHRQCGKKTVDQRHLIECIVCDATRVQYDLNIIENLVDIMFRIISCWHSWLLYFAIVLIVWVD